MPNGLNGKEIKTIGKLLTFKRISHPMDDQLLVENVQQGSLKAFEALFKRFYKPLCTYAFRFVRDADLSGQLVQDVFFHIWEKHAQFEVTSNLQAYLLFAVRNECLKYLRHSKVEQKYAQKMLNESSAYTTDWNDTTTLHELTRTIGLTLHAMPERTREIFMLSRFQKLRYSEIAVKLGISIKTVESNMGKALKLFRETLSAFND